MDSGGSEGHLLNVSLVCIVLGSTGKGSNIYYFPCLGKVVALQLRKWLF